MARTVSTSAFHRLNLLAAHASLNAPHRARFHNFAADFEDMFPTPPGNATQRDDARSALGPSAYLVDLARLVKEQITQPNDQLTLAKRRPDIFTLALSQANDDQSVPYLQIANGVMRAYLEQTLQIKPSALEALALSYFPFSMPFHQPLTAIRSYLSHFKIDLATIDAAFGSGTSDPAWAAEMLNLAPGELAYLATPKTDPADLNIAYGVTGISGDTALGGLDKVAIFLAQTDLTQPQLALLLQVDLPGPRLSLNPLIAIVVGQSQANRGDDPQTIRLAANTPADADYTGAQLTITAGLASGQARTIIDYNASAQIATLDTALTLPPDPSSPFTYSISWQSIDGLNLANLGYLNRFMRLANRLGWSFDDLSWALGSADNQGDLQALAKIAYLRKTFNLPIDVLCSFWSNLRTTPPLDRPNAAPLFDRIFAPFALIGSAQAGTTSTIMLAASAAAASDSYVGMQITITAGAGAGQSGTITAYDGRTNTATIASDWRTSADSSSSYTISYPYIIGVAKDVAGAATQIILAAATPANAISVGMQITITAGTGAGQTRTITGYNGIYNIATVDAAWAPAPDLTSVYTIITYPNPTSLATQQLLIRLRTILLGALQLNDADAQAALDHLLALAGGSLTLDLPTLTRLYRLSRLPTLFAMTLTDLLILLKLIAAASTELGAAATPSLAQAEVRSIDDLLALADWVAWMKAAGLNAPQLQYLTSAALASAAAQAVGPALTPAAATTAVGNYLQQLPGWGIAPTALALGGMAPSLAAAIVARLRARGLLDENGLVLQPADALTGETIGAAIANRFFALTSAGLMVSDDQGSSWRPVEGLPTAVTKLAVNDETLVVTSTDGFYVSTNDGIDWIKLDQTINGVPITNVFTSLYTKHLFALANNLLYYRDRAEAAWSQYSSPRPDFGPPRAVVFNDGNAFVYSYDPNDAHPGILATYPDAQMVFYHRSPGPEFPQGLALTQVGTSNNRIIISGNNGAYYFIGRQHLEGNRLWAQISGAINQQPIEQLIVSNNRLVAIAGGRLYAATNAVPDAVYTDFYVVVQVNWKPVGGKIARKTITQIVTSNALVLALSDDNKLYVSEDSGISWKRALQVPSQPMTQIALVGDDSQVQRLLAQHVAQQSPQYQAYLQSVAKLLNDALLQQTAGSTSFWATALGTDATTVAASLAFAAGVAPQTPIAPAIVQACQIAIGTAVSGTASSIVLQADATKSRSYQGYAIIITGGMGAGQTRTIVADGASSDPVTVNLPWATIPDSTSHYAVVDLSLIQQAAQLLFLATALALPAQQFEAILRHANLFGIPAAGDGIPLSGLRQIVDFNRLTQQFARHGDLSKLTALLNAPTNDPQTNSAEGLLHTLQPATTGDPTTLAMLSGWDADQIAVLAAQLGVQPPYTLPQLSRLQRCFELAARLGVHIQLLIDLYQLHADSGQIDKNWPAYTHTAQAFLSVVRARYSAAVWQKTFGPIRDRLNELERDALAALLLRQLQAQFADITTMQDLYEFLLVDVQMGGCAQTSYVREAIDCLQIYIQRCRMNLEAGATLSPAIPEQMWDWMGAYRMWQANRTIFFYPENYLDPTLRANNVSPEFELLRNALLQSNISQDTVEQAYIDYFDRLDVLANLQIVNGCYATVYNPNSGEPQNTLFLIGKTATDPPVYYQRQAMLVTVAGMAQQGDGEATTITLASDTIAPADDFANLPITIISGAGTGQTRIITAYDDTSQIATVSAPWQTTPDATSRYNISRPTIAGWSPWQKIDVNIAADQALPLYAADRLYIFWVEQKIINDRDDSGKRLPPQTLATIKFSYQQVSGNWIQAQTLAKDVDLATLPQAFWFTSGAAAAQGTDLFLAQQAGTSGNTPQTMLSLVTPDWASTLQPLAGSLFAAPASVIGGIAVPVSHGGLFTITNTDNGPLASLVNGVAGAVTQIFANGSDLYVGTSEGLFSNTNNNTWEQIPAVTGAVTHIAFANLAMYVGTSHGLFASTDGKTWSQIPSVTGAVSLIYSIGGGILYVGTSQGLFDGPPTWASERGVTGTVSQIARNDVVFFVGTSQGLFVNAGNSTWSQIPSVTGAVTQIFANGSVIYVGSSQGIFFSTDGNIWNQIPSVTGAVTQIFANGSVIYVGTSQGIFFSTDGNAWNQIPSVTGAVSQIVVSNPLAANPVMYAGTSQSLFASTDGNTWNQIPGVTGAVTQIALIDSTTYIGTSQGLFASTDGETWDRFRIVTGEVSQIVLGAPGIYVGIDTNLPETTATIPLIAAGGDTWLALPQPQAGNPQTYVVERLTTSCIEQLRQILVQGGIDALLTLQAQQLAETTAFANLQPTKAVVRPDPSDPSDMLDFDLSSAYGLYFREIFFHIPYLVGTALQAHQQFAAAKRWYEYIFDPLAPLDQQAPHPADRFWRYLPFRSPTLEDLVAAIEQQRQYQAYQDDPFDPFAIAELRPYAYQKALAMQYIDNLIAWGDSLYALDGWENLNAATTLYVLAAELLGPRPHASKRFTQINGRIAPNVLSAGSDTHQPQPTLTAIWQALSGAGNALANPFFDVPACFVIPENDAFAGYWNTVEQRLYQIRNCMNLQGVVRQLPIYDPAIDPRQLLRALAAGRSIGATTNRAAVAVPYYRFAYLLERARQVVAELKQLGGDLLGALEKQDGEQLARLRNTYEGAILALTTLIKQKQQEENQHSLDGLQQNLAAAQARYSRYQGWATQYLSPGEQAGLSATQAASTLREAASAVKTLSAIGYALPNIYGLADGGMDFGAVIEVGADVLLLEAGILEWAGQLAMTKAQYDRRQADWQLQADMANYEVQQISAQLDALSAHQAIVDQELVIHQQSITQNQGIDQFYRQKFSSQELYQWMVGQLGALYAQTYQLALDLARMTERSFQYERDTDTSYVNVNGWDSLKQGLLAGEGLALNLNQLEKAYIEQDVRRLEIEKIIALSQLDPQALLDLKRTGSCSFAFSEALFDLDFPGHYLRKIKTIALSIPAVIGPYQNIHATLIQQSNQVVLKPDLATMKFLLQEPGSQPPASGMLRSNWQANQHVAISRGMGDAGLFELNFNDERYLPFEGTGALSSWQLRMPMASNRFAFDSISDVIITLRYTALDGGDAFRRKLLDKNQGAKALQTLSGYRLFMARQLNPAGWQALQAKKQTSLDLTIDKTFFPRNLGSIAPDPTRPIAVYGWPAKAVGTLTCPLSLPPTGATPPTWTTTKDGMGWEYTPASTDPLTGKWTVQAFQETIDDLLIIVPFQGALNWGS